MFRDFERWYLPKAIKIVERQKAPERIPMSGARALQNDFYTLYLNSKLDGRILLADGIDGDLVHGRWLATTGQELENGTIPVSDLSNYTPEFQYYYRGWSFGPYGVWTFVKHRFWGYPFWKVLTDRALQWWFNRRDLQRQDRMRVLRYAVDEATSNEGFRISPVGYMSHLYGPRWVHRADQESYQAHYRLVIESLAESGELKAPEHGQYGYAVRGRAVATIAAFELDERRHRENSSIQRRIVFLTAAVVVIGGAQAVAALVETFGPFTSWTWAKLW